MRRLGQIQIVGLLSLRHFPSRLRSSWVVVVALTVISVVLLSASSAEEGIKLAYLGVGHTDRAVITSLGSTREPTSSVPISWLTTISGSVGIRKARDGTPLADAQVYDFIGPLTEKDGSRGATEVRGIGPKGLQMSPEIRVTDGRYYRPGTREVVHGNRR